MPIDGIIADRLSALEIGDSLQKTEQRYRAMFENMNSGVAVYEPLDGGSDFKIIDFNSAAERIDQISRKQVIGKKLLDVFPYIDKIGFLACLQRVNFTGQAENHPAFYYEDEHRKGWRQNFVYKLMTGDIVAIYEDITDRKNAEEALRMSEDRWQFALEGAGDGIWDWNVQTSEVFYSKQWKSMLGYQEHEIGNTLDEWETRIHPDDKEICLLKLENYFRGETAIYESEHRLKTNDGAYKWVLDRGKVISWTSDGLPERMIGTHSDISVRKELEEDLRISDEKLSKAFLLCPDAISISRVADGLFVMANHGVERVLGYTRQEVLGKTVHELNIWNDPEDRKRLTSRLMSEGRVENFEASYRTKRGEIRSGLLSAGIITLNGVKHILNVTRDITEIKQATKALQEATSLANHLRIKAEAATRAKSDFLANMSHELRTPMSSIIGFAELLQNEFAGSLSFKQKAYVEEISDAGRHLLHLINDILDLSKVESGKITLRQSITDLSELVRKSFSMVSETAAEKNIKLESEIAKEFEHKHILADSVRLKQILMNLLSNALKFTPSGGKIKLAAHYVTNEIIISIADTGIGIQQEDQQRIFDKFEQVQSSRTIGESGAGLGLSVTRMLVELHGGHISVESEGRNKGSLFRFAIPLIWAEKQHHESGSETPATESIKQIQESTLRLSEHDRPTILVVEDDKPSMKLVSNLLEAGGYNSIEAFSAEEAISILENQRPALILMDVSLPGIDGIKATQIIKNNSETAEIPVVALSAHAMPEDDVKALKAGCEAYLTKPIETRKFFNTLSEVLRTQQHVGIE